MPPMGMGSEPKKSGVGALIGSIIVILILVLGALYFWGGKLTREEVGETLEQGSDEVADIDSDFSDLETINLDDDLNTLNQ